MAEVGPILIAPNGETTTTLHLVGDTQLGTGKWDGFIIFSPQGAVDIVNNRAPVNFETFTPQITFSAKVISMYSEKVCWQWAPITLILKTVSTSLVPEKINIQLQGIDGREPITTNH